jgi:tRNA nucleotidyltransferase (CCA-adding enzyme)
VQRFADKIPKDVVGVVERLTEAGHRAFLVGGCVRDLMREQEPKDFDLATSARPDEVKKVFPKVIPTGIEHGTVTVVVKGRHLEITTFRSESDYVDGRRPQKVEFHTDIEADLARRDFTINAMAYDPAKDELVDPFGGQGDLQQKIIRCVRSALERFGEDGLRALRAVRFATVLEFEIEKATFDAIAPTIPVFKKVATERVNTEFQKILMHPTPARGLQLLSDSGLAAAFIPEANAQLYPAVERAAQHLELRLAVLLDLAADPAGAVARLKFPSKTIDLVKHLVAHRHLPPSSATDADLRRWLAKVGLDAFSLVLDAARALGREEVQLAQRIRTIAAARPPLSSKDLALDGRAIMQVLGVGPSPAVGIATRKLLEAVLDNPEQNTPEKLKDLLSRGQV